MLTMDDLVETSPGIFYTDRSFVTAGPAVIEILKETARKLPIGRARLCAHPDPEAEQQDMLIVSDNSTYVAPHRHLNKSESLVVLEGQALALLFEEDGTLRGRTPIGPAGSDRACFYRMPARLFHSLIIESEQLIFVESTKGPFDKSTSEDAPWAPGPTESGAGRQFLSQFV